jgi:hypothetical protein
VLLAAVIAAYLQEACHVVLVMQGNIRCGPDGQLKAPAQVAAHTDHLQGKEESNKHGTSGYRAAVLAASAISKATAGMQGWHAEFTAASEALGTT